MQHSQPSSKMATMTHSHLFSIEPIPRVKNSSPNSPNPNVGPISVNPNYTLTITPKLPNPPVSLFFQSPNSNGGDGSRGRGHSRRPLPMKLNAATVSLLSPHAKTPLSLRPRSLMATSVTQTVTLALPSDAPVMAPDEDSLCSKHPGGGEGTQQFSSLSTEPLLGLPTRCLSGESRVERAWAHWRKLGQPRLIVAPMVDNSELPFRMLCRKYGAEAAYTPMLHSRLFSESEKYRAQEFSTCKEDRPLFVQFCANDPDVLLEAAQRVEPYCDYVDINLGCPQRIAKRGNYGAFLMDNLPLVKSLVENLAHNLHVPVSCKIRVFPDLEDTIRYARMLEDAGCSLLAVHGRKRDEKDQKKVRADWKAIKAVKDALRIPVLANGNIRHMDDVQTCLEETGADGVLSADSLLENPALFAGYRTAEWVVGNEASHEDGKLDQADLLVEYLNLCEQYPVPWRMIRAHVHKMMGEWFRIHPHVREDLNAQNKLTFEFLYNMVDQLRELDARIPLYTKNAHAANISANETAA